MSIRSPFMSVLSVPHRLWALLAVGCLWLSLPAALAVPDTSPAEGKLLAGPVNGAEIRMEQIDAAREALNTAADLPEETKNKALELYDQAAGWLRDAQAVRGQIAALEERVRTAPQRMEEIRKSMAAPAAALVTPAGADLEQIEQRISQEELDLSQTRGALKAREDELSRLLVGGKGLIEEIADGTRALEQIDKDLAAAAQESSGPLAQARTLSLKVRRQLREGEITLWRKTLDNQGLLTNLVQAERDLLVATVAEIQPRSTALKVRAQNLRKEQAAQARKEAEALKDRTSGLPASLQAIADQNARYRQELEALLRKDRNVSRELGDSARGLDEIKADFERTRQRVEVVGPSVAIGKMLRQRRAALPSVQKYRRRSSERAEAISAATDRQLEIDEQLRASLGVEREVAAALEQLPQERRTELRADVQALIEGRRDSLNELQKSYGRYIIDLTSLDLAEQQLVEVAQAFVDYIDDQLIWIPSTGLYTLFQADGERGWELWFLKPDNWLLTVGDLSASTQRNTGAYLILALLVGAMLYYRRRVPGQLHQIDQAIRKIRTDRFALTLRALGLALVAAWPIPLLLLGVGWLLVRLPTAHAFTLSLAGGLIDAGLLYASLGLVRQLCREENIGDRHLNWPQPVRSALLRVLRWFIPLGLLESFMIGATAGSSPTELAQAGGGMAFIILMVAVSYAAKRLLGRHGAVKEHVLDRAGGGWAGHLHFLWFPLAVGTPLGLALVSLFGYHYTAVHLEQRVQMTLWFFFGLLLLRDLILRWLYVAERRLRFEDALRRREELRAQRAREEEHPEEGEQPISVEIQEVNYDSLSDQSKRLVHAGFLFSALIGTWAVWSELLPALAFFETTTLPFEAERLVDGVARTVPVTLGDLATGLFIALITVLAAKNLPGILEISLLQRLPLEAGARYAITALAQYSIAGIGIVAAFSQMGLQWSSIQWLVAALSVGLGFGLQEIVANFVSGIILLFERPIRVGDVVTLDTTTGVVTRIRIRATTIVNYDKQELLIPNKEFITGRVVNWTLTDRMNRVVVTVGVAYGSDVARAMSLMLEAAAENENVLKDPKPVATFEGFGDNALTLLLRTYLGNLDNRLATITALHQAINDKFLAAGINIAFPQRDVHLETGKPLDIRLHRASRGRE
jgi:potassium efflux system protein